MVCHPFHKTACKTSGFVRQNATECAFATSDSWVILTPIEQSIKRKIEAVGTPLKDWDIQINYGIKTGCNEAFIIDEAKRAELIAADPKSAEIIRPILRGRDIKRYGYNYAGLYLIATFPARHYDIEQYPAVKHYLLSFDKERLLEAGIDDIANNAALLTDFCRQRLEQSGKDIIINGHKVIIDGKAQKARKKTGNKWFETQDQIGYWEDFNQQLIVYNDIAQRLTFAMTSAGTFTNNTVYFIKGEEKTLCYLLAYLNSNLIDWYYRTLSVQLGTKAVRMFSIYMEKLPIPLFEMGKNAPHNETEIFESYGLNEEEIKYLLKKTS